jgi:hypothetical protein
VVTVVLALGGCGSDRGLTASARTEPGRTASGGLGNGGPGLAALVRERRPIGRGPRFHPPATGPFPGPCRGRLGRRLAVHVELFAADRAVLVPGGIGARPPWRRFAGRITGARCYGAVVTLEPTGVVLVRADGALRLGALFRAWGQPLSRRRLASFGARHGRGVTVYVDGRLRRGVPGSVRLFRHAEIVLEIGPPVPPHAVYTFPPGT